jgi:two-component system, NarL family, nitrate/nitrite response regulator NarL
MKLRIAIADDHPVVRKGLAQFIAEEEDLDLVAECRDGNELIEILKLDPPDIALVDLRMRECGGMDVLRFAHEQHIPTRFIILAGNITDDEVLAAMRLGAKGIVLKELAPTLLMQSIRKVAGGDVWLEKDSIARVMERLLDHQQRRETIKSLLTHRELEIVRMVVQGLGNREIGEALFISEGTVKSHLRSIFEKLGVKSRMQLAAMAREDAAL